jgi:hypothetical protein
VYFVTKKELILISEEHYLDQKYYWKINDIKKLNQEERKGTIY